MTSQLSGAQLYALDRTLDRSGLARTQFDLYTLGTVLPRGRTVVPLGKDALAALRCERIADIMPWSGYAYRSFGGDSWVLPTYGVEDITGGLRAHTPAFLRHIEKALRIARDGYREERFSLVLDPSPEWFADWVAEFLRFCRTAPSHVLVALAYDIETPYSRGQDEDDVHDISYTILRVSFSWRDGEAVTVPFQTAYIPAIRRLLAEMRSLKMAVNHGFDRSRLAAAGCPVMGPLFDIQAAFHTLFPAMRKRLELMVPLFLDVAKWKHTSHSDPVRYSALDGAYEYALGLRVMAELRATGLWDYHEHNVLQVEPRLERASSAGIAVDPTARRAAFDELNVEYQGIASRMQEVVPVEVRKLDPPRGFVRTPADTGGLVQIELPASVAVCARCGAGDVTKTSHTARKTFGRRVKGGPRPIANPCYSAEIREERRIVRRFARLLPFAPSNQQLQSYCRVARRRPIVVTDKKTHKRRISFDDVSLDTLIRRYPKDALFPIVKRYRELEKLIGYTGWWSHSRQKWEGGPPIHPDGRVHPRFTFTPWTGRLAAEDPNVQQIPKRGAWAKAIRKMFVPGAGMAFAELDFSAIEAVIVGYLARDRHYVRLARLGVHDFLNSHLLADDGKIGAPADVTWNDDDLRALFVDLKKRFKAEREVAKRIVHSSAYGATPMRVFMMDPRLLGDVANTKRLQDFYFGLFPSLREWQRATIEEADKYAYLQTPFGNVAHFFRAKEWQKGRESGEWAYVDGADAKAALSFRPQSIAAGIIKRVIRLMPDEMVQWFRAQIHDALLFEAPAARVESLIREVAGLMTAPVPELELPPEWGLGTHLAIGVEAQQSETSWADMCDVHVSPCQLAPPLAA